MEVGSHRIEGLRRSLQPSVKIKLTFDFCFFKEVHRNFCYCWCRGCLDFGGVASRFHLFLIFLIF